jgi:small ligand-binding sensory domain FIST
MPAIDLLTEFVGEERVKDFGHILNLFELGEKFEGRGYDGDILNRAIIGLDRERGGIRLAVEIDEGTKVRITRRDMDLVLKRTAQMTRDLIGTMEKPDEAAYFYFNCSGRGSYL